MVKIKKLLRIDHIGQFWREGYGKVEWIRGNFGTRSRGRRKKKPGWIKIRKGLPHHLPDHITQLIRYALLHDFAHTSKHKSKIYVEPNLTEIEHLRQHHDSTDDPLIQAFQWYDRTAASMTRNIRSPRTNRYTWEAKGTIDFKTLTHELEQVEDNIWQLYQYIYQSKELQQLNESLSHGHSSLRHHLLLIVNLIVQDYLRGNL